MVRVKTILKEALIMSKEKAVSATRNNRTICLPFSQETYAECINNAKEFRKYIDEHIRLFPELFPPEISNGYLMKDSYPSEKQGIRIRRIDINGVFYTIRPSFMMPYMTGTVEDVEKALFLRKFDVPFWGLSHVFGRDPMYWYRVEKALGRNSIVGTTVREPDDIPEDIGADEKHTWIKGDKVYVATTVGNGCILGASVAQDAGEASLTAAYQVFKEEAQSINPSYEPETVNIDGWQATRKAWLALFATTVIICCFLHIFIKIRDRAKKKHKTIFDKAADKLWNCYQADSKRTFSQRIRRLAEWCKNCKIPDVIANPIKKLLCGQNSVGSNHFKKM